MCCQIVGDNLVISDMKERRDPEGLNVLVRRTVLSIFILGTSYLVNQHSFLISLNFEVDITTSSLIPCDNFSVSAQLS